jgi:adenylate kinase family enzyme
LSRIAEFKDKTTPVLETYGEMGILTTVYADGTRDEVFVGAVDAIYDFAIDKA